jgi:hypothetical protein
MVAGAAMDRKRFRTPHSIFMLLFYMIQSAHYYTIVHRGAGVKTGDVVHNLSVPCEAWA